MSDSVDNQDQFEMLEAALLGEVPPVEPLRSEFQARIVSSIRSASGDRRRYLTFRRFAVGAAAIAAAVLLVVGLQIMNPGGAGPDNPGLSRPGKTGGQMLATIRPKPAIVDDSIVAVEKFAAGSVVQEMRDLAKDATEIGGTMLAALPGDLVSRRAGWLTGFREK